MNDGAGTEPGGGGQPALGLGVGQTEERSSEKHGAMPMGDGWTMELPQLPALQHPSWEVGGENKQRANAAKWKKTGGGHPTQTPSFAYSN